jgi:hypothetical protein
MQTQVFFFFFCRFFVHFFHKVQEPLFNDTVFRYMLQHDLFVGLQQTLIDDVDAVSIVATLGTKVRVLFSCFAAHHAYDRV